MSPKYGKIETLIDKKDWLHVKKYRLYVHRVGHYFYIRFNLNGRKESLQRYLLQPIPNKMVVDHINRNTLDNRRKNLRIVTIQDNLRNQKRPNNKTGYTGVAVHKQTGKYTAQIKVNYKKIHLGIFKTIEEAYEARKIGEQKYW